MDELIRKQDAIDALYHVDEYNARSVEAIRNLSPVQISCENGIKIERYSQDTISRQDAIDAVNNLTYPSSLVDVKRILVDLPSVQPTNEMLERCKFEYIHACKIVSIPTPDVTGKDIQDAYAVIKALQPIFGDVPFAKVKRGEAE